MLLRSEDCRGWSILDELNAPGMESSGCSKDALQSDKSTDDYPAKIRLAKILINVHSK